MVPWPGLQYIFKQKAGDLSALTIFLPINDQNESICDSESIYSALTLYFAIIILP